MSFYIEVPKKLTPTEQQMMRELEQDAFPDFGAVDEQTFVPIARYGKLIWYKQEQDERPVAVAEVLRDYDAPQTAYIFGYYVRSDYQGQGLGKQFLQEVLRLIQEDGFSDVVLTVATANPSAVRVYEKLGFVIEETREDEFGEQEHRYFMRHTFC